MWWQTAAVCGCHWFSFLNTQGLLVPNNNMCCICIIVVRGPVHSLPLFSPLGFNIAVWTDLFLTWLIYSLKSMCSFYDCFIKGSNRETWTSLVVVCLSLWCDGLQFHPVGFTVYCRCCRFYTKVFISKAFLSTFHHHTLVLICLENHILLLSAVCVSCRLIHVERPNTSV